MRKNTHPVYSGAFLLTITGLFCRFIGFYYKIFLSRAIGAKELGLYQLSMPLLSIGIAFANAGIHTAISRYVAGAAISSKATGKRYLAAGLLLSLSLGALFCIPAYALADVIAARFFLEPSITQLLRILIFCIPLECIHGCINGYYYGLQKAAIPSGGQCIEQLSRVGSVMGIYYLLQQMGIPFTKNHAMLGLLIGEAVATLYYLTILSLDREDSSAGRPTTLLSYRTAIRNIGSMAYPVTGTRLSLTLLNSLENILIPAKLAAFGMTNTQALSIYGIYSGMAIPMIFFPTVLANSIAVMLLPSIARAKEENRISYITHTIITGFFLCMLLGFACTFFFFFFGGFIGQRIFNNEVAGIYIRTLSWLCPFLFLGITMNSILNGLGRTKDTFAISITGALIRLSFVIVGIQRFGFRAFLLGALLSQIISSFLAYIRLMSLCPASVAKEQANRWRKKAGL